MQVVKVVQEEEEEEEDHDLYQTHPSAVSENDDHDDEKYQSDDVNHCGFDGNHCACGIDCGISSFAYSMTPDLRSPSNQIFGSSKQIVHLGIAAKQTAVSPMTNLGGALNQIAVCANLDFCLTFSCRKNDGWNAYTVHELEKTSEMKQRWPISTRAIDRKAAACMRSTRSTQRSNENSHERRITIDDMLTQDAYNNKHPFSTYDPVEHRERPIVNRDESKLWSSCDQHEDTIMN